MDMKCFLSPSIDGSCKTIKNLENLDSIAYQMFTDIFTYKLIHVKLIQNNIRQKIPLSVINSKEFWKIHINICYS